MTWDLDKMLNYGGESVDYGEAGPVIIIGGMTKAEDANTFATLLQGKETGRS